MKITIPSRLTEAANNPINNSNTNISAPTPTSSYNNAPPPNSVHTLGSLLFHTLRDAKKDGRPLAFEFQHLPPRSHFPDYYALIKKPLSFAEIRAKLERRDYTSLKQVSDDFHTMFMNAKKYNVKGSGIYTDAKKLDKLNRTTYERLMGNTGMSASAAGQAKDSDGEEDEASPQLPATATIPPPAPVASTSSYHPPPPGHHKRVYRPEYTSTGELINPPSQTMQDSNKQQKKKLKLQTSTSTSIDRKGADDKPPTLTKWLTAKLDDLSELTDNDGRRLADVFVQLPRKDLYPDYYQLISKPVSLHLVRSRLKNRNYPTIASFISDVSTIFSNAQFYNQEESLIYSDSVKMNDYFNEIMKEEPPEFSVRPRKADKQQQQQGRQSPFPGVGLGTPTTETMRLDLSGSQAAYNGGFSTGQSQSSAGFNPNHLQQAPSSGISFDLGGTEGIENIQFEDTFDEQEQENDRPAYEQSQQQSQQRQQVKREDSQTALTLPQSAPQRIGLSPLATTPNQFSLAQNGAPTSPRPVLKLSSVQPPTIASFDVRFMRFFSGESSREALVSSYTFHNHTVRSHSYACPSDIDHIEIKIRLRPGAPSWEELDTGVSVRPVTTVQMPSAELRNEQEEGLWAIKLSKGLNTIEFKLHGTEEYYRLFISNSG